MKREQMLKRLEKTKGENTMLKNKKRNNINSISCYNSSAFDIGRSEYKFNIR